MDKYDVSADVLLEAAQKTEINLKDHCDIYSSVGREAAKLLERYSSVDRVHSDAVARSKLGTPIASPSGEALVLAMRVTIRINDDGRTMVEGKTKEHLVAALRQTGGSA